MFVNETEFVYDTQYTARMQISLQSIYIHYVLSDAISLNIVEHYYMYV